MSRGVLRLAVVVAAGGLLAGCTSPVPPPDPAPVPSGEASASITLDPPPEPPPGSVPVGLLR